MIGIKSHQLNWSKRSSISSVGKVGHLWSIGIDISHQLTARQIMANQIGPLDHNAPDWFRTNEAARGITITSIDHEQEPL